MNTNRFQETGPKKSTLQALYRLTRVCEICPRRCRVGRLTGKTGICRALKFPEISSHTLHFGEEPPISGIHGSGTIFLTHCNLRCIFCQNYPISHLGNGQAISIQKLVEMMLSLQSRGAHNINFVTPTHYAAQIAHAIVLARRKGLTIPIVYNTSGYERVETLRHLEGLIDIYMPDIKFVYTETAKRYAAAPDYYEVAKAAVKEMHRQVGNLTLNRDGIAIKGLIIRHLVLPGHVDETGEILRFIAEEISPRSYVSLMSQYFPAYRAFEDPDLSRRITQHEYETAKQYLKRYHLDFGWTQEIN